MKHFIAKAAAGVAVMGAIAIACPAHSIEISPAVPEVPIATAATKKAATLNHQQVAWLGALEFCESKGNPAAINPKDLDNTPSYGILQFKPGTLTQFEKAYGIKGSLMDADAQIAIVTQMILRGGINWHRQFPDCTAELGLPPLST